MRKSITKVLLAMLILLMAFPVWAGQLKQTVIPATTLGKASPTTSGSTYTGEAKRVAFFVTYDSSDVTVGVTTTLTAQISYNGTDWAPMSWYDTDGGVTPQTSEILLSDGNYAMWMPPVPAPYIKITATMVNASVYGSGDIGKISITVVKDE